MVADTRPEHRVLKVYDGPDELRLALVADTRPEHRVLKVSVCGVAWGPLRLVADTRPEHRVLKAGQGTRNDCQL